MAPSKARTSRDLLQLEHSDTFSASGAKFLSIRKAKQSRGIHWSSLRTTPLGDVVEENSVLRRVQAFLPVLDEANRKLAEAIKEKGPDNYDIEVLKSHETNAYVEMDLALGVADLHSKDAIAAAERLAGGWVINTGISRIATDEKNYHSDSGDEGLFLKRKRPPKIEPIN